jgi:O-antigen/teichoic acid export membrane protein
MSAGTLERPLTDTAVGENRPLHRAAYSLLLNSAVTSLLGVGFWVAAARLYPATTVGRDTVLLAVMVELSTICQLNLGNGIARFLPDLGADTGRALAAAYSAALVFAVLAGTVFVLVAPGLAHGLRFLADDTLLAVGFVVSLAAWGIFVLQDAALTATRRAAWVPVENGLFGVLKLAALPVLLTLGTGDGVFLAWALPMALLIVPVNILIFQRAIPAHAGLAAGRSSLVRLGALRAARFLGADYLGSVFAQATLTALPLIVIGVLGSRQSAFFAMPFAIAIAFDTFAYGACASLVVEANLAPERLRELARTFARRVAALLVPAAAAAALGAPLLLRAFGHAYAQHGTLALRLLLGASLLRVVLAMFSAVSRARGQAGRLALLEGTVLLLVAGAALPLARAHGIDGVAAAWLAANALVCAPAALQLLKLLREG